MRRVLAALACLCVLPALAETNLAWVPTSASNRNVGSWQIAQSGSLVLSGSSWSGASIVQFGGLASTAPVYACTANVPIGQTDGCPTPGNYSQEGFIQKSQVNQGAAPPPPPPEPPPPPVWAEGTATLSWNAPTLRTDGSAIVGPLSYRIVNQSGVTVATVSALSYTVTGLPAGVHCWRVIAIEGGVASDPSNEACKTIVEDAPPPPPPPPPAVVVVANVAGISHAVVFGVTSSGGRSSTVVGFAAVGAACEGPVLFRYRNQDYRRLASGVVLFWATTPTVNAAAACR